MIPGAIKEKGWQRVEFRGGDENKQWEEEKKR